MKLERGYTYPQFIDLIKSKGSNIADLLIYSFNDLCKNEITEKMIINKMSFPELSYVDNDEKLESKYKEWQEAEKNIIFDEWKKAGDINGYYEYGDYNILFHSCGLIQIGHKDKRSEYIKTLGDIFNYSNGELKTKNIEL